MTQLILAGIKVIDLSMWLPGPYCSTILGDLGAEVVKVERRLMGDPSRMAYPRINHESCLFLALNRNKKSIALNLKRTEGREILLRLAATADVILDGFKPGYVDDIGIGYEDIREPNPRVVYCSLSGYGQDGPHAHRAGHDINYTALGGLLDLISPSETPMLPGVQIADLSAALFATVGILAALVQRAATGRGMYLDVSMMDSVVSLLGPSTATLLCGKAARENNRFLIGHLPSYNLYRTSDGRYMALGAIEPTFWTDFCRAIGREDLTPKQFPDESEREDIIGDLQETFARRTQAEWVAFFANKNVCCEPVNSLEEALAHPQVQHRGIVFYVDHPTAGRIGQTGLPIHFRDSVSGDAAARRTHGAVPPPLLGQHTVEILRDLGYHNQAINRLRQEKVIAVPDDTPPPKQVAER